LFVLLLGFLRRVSFVPHRRALRRRREPVLCCVVPERFSVMDRSSQGSHEASTQNEGHSRHRGDKFVPRKFAVIARALWPRKTAAHIAAIAHVTERTGKRILRGEADVPGKVATEVLKEMYED